MSAIAKRYFNAAAATRMLAAANGGTPMNDDIDWSDASADFGLILLCREMAALARPAERIAGFARRPRRKAQRRAQRPANALEPCDGISAA
jgi:hypothetical protein